VTGGSGHYPEGAVTILRLAWECGIKVKSLGTYFCNDRIRA
jgi:hypothetical protein